MLNYWPYTFYRGHSISSVQIVWRRSLLETRQSEVLWKANILYKQPVLLTINSPGRIKVATIGIHYWLTHFVLSGDADIRFSTFTRTYAILLVIIMYIVLYVEWFNIIALTGENRARCRSKLHEINPLDESFSGNSLHFSGITCSTFRTNAFHFN